MILEAPVTREPPFPVTLRETVVSPLAVVEGKRAKAAAIAINEALSLFIAQSPSFVRRLFYYGTACGCGIFAV
jgi:hypothetical protein